MLALNLMIRCLVVAVTAVLLTLAAGRAQAAPGEPDALAPNPSPRTSWAVRHFTVADGLPVASVQGVRMDANGFLWLATFDGLVRFDGQRFDVYDQAGKPEMPSNRYIRLGGGRDAPILALTLQGELVEVTTSAVRRVRPDPGAPDAPVLSVDPDSACVTLTTGFFCPDASHRFVEIVGWESASGIRHIARGPDGAVWRHIPGEGIWLQSPDGDLRKMVGAIDGDLAPQDPLLALDDGSLLVAASEEVLRIRPGAHVTSVLPDVPGPDALGEILQLARSDAGIWLATTRGLFILDLEQQLLRPALQGMPVGLSRLWTLADGSHWYRIGNRLFQDGRLVLEPGGRVEDVFLDRNGAVWVGTATDGLYALTRPRVQRVDAASGLTSKNVYSVALDRAGRLWTGSLGGGVQQIDLGSGPPSVQSYHKAHGLLDLNTWLVTVGPDDRVLAAPFDGGVYQRSPRSERFTPVKMPAALSSAQQRVLSHDQQGRLWIGGEGGAWRRDSADWRRHWPTDDGKHTVTAILGVGDGEFWYGTMRGLWYQKNGVSREIAPSRFGGVQIRGLYRDRAGVIWVSTQGQGLFRIEAGTAAGDWSIVRLGQAQGLPSNTPHAVVEDAAGTLWINSNQGIHALRRPDLQAFLGGRVAQLTPLLVTPADGIRHLEGNGGVQPSAAVDSSGRIWFPTQGGLIGLHPEALTPRALPPVAVIDRVQSGNREWSREPGLAFPPGARSPTIGFAAADLYGGTAARFRYRLLPGEPTWRDVRDQRSVSFIRLNPGSYRFQVIAADSYGRWSEQPAEIAFAIPPFWYETRWFRTLAITMAAAATLLFAAARTRTTRRRAAELDRQVRQRTGELAAEKQRLQSTLGELGDAHRALETSHEAIASRNRRLAEQAERLAQLDGFRKRLLADVSHELRTPLMLIEMPLAHLDRDARAGAAGFDGRRAREIAVARQQSERLHALLAQLITLVEAESGQLELSIARVDIAALLEQLRHTYGALASRHDIELTLSLPASTPTIYADRQHLETALGNLFGNAVKHAPDGGNVEVRLRVDRDRDSLQVEVRDDGPGFDAATGRTLFERFCRGENQPARARAGLGIGLALAREIVDLHGGRIGADSAPGAGAVFWVELPLGSTHVAIEDLALEADPDSGMVALATQTSEPVGETLVLVEDHPELAAYLADRLREWLPVTVFGDAESALEALPGMGAGLLVCDVVLPEMTGLDLCRRVRAEPRLAPLPVVLISARATGPDQRAGLEAGADAYLVKPFGFEQLLATIRRLWPAGAARLDPAAQPPHEHPVLALALEHLADPEFDVAVWAKRAHLSGRHLRRQVGELTGQSPMVWLREQRLLRVRALIDAGECKTLAEAGARAGLDNPAYLYRLYRARFGRD